MRRLGKFLRLPSAERHLLGEAVLVLWMTRLGLWLLPLRRFRSVMAQAVEWTRPSAGPRASLPTQVGWAVTVASRYVPRATCLAQALTVLFLLERRGYVSDLRIGLARGTDERVKGHAWVEHQGEIVIGQGFAPEVVLREFEGEERHGR